MLIALIIWLLGSGGGAELRPLLERLKDLGVYVEREIPDKQRRKDVLELIDTMERVGKGIDKRAAEMREDAFKLARRRDAGRADFETLLAPVHERYARDREQLLDLRFQLRDKLTREEWSKAFAGKAAAR